MDTDNEPDKTDTAPIRIQVRDAAGEQVDDTQQPAPEAPDENPEPTSPSEPVGEVSEQPAKSSFNLNKYFLYTLVGGLIISALISVVAVLIGEFNATMSRALGTTVTMVIHTLIALVLISASSKSKRPNGSFLINTLIFITIASFITSLLSIWDVLTGQIVVDLYALYFYTFFASLWSRLLLRVGGALADKPTRIISLVAIGFTALFYVLLIPSTFTHYPATLPDVYYRGMAATAILLATTSVLTTVFHRIHLFKHPELKSLPSVKSGWDIILAFIVLFVGIPYLFIAMVSLTMVQRANEATTSSTDHSFNADPTPAGSQTTTQTRTEEPKDCSTETDFSAKTLQLNPTQYSLESHNLSQKQLTVKRNDANTAMPPIAYTGELLIVDADCKAVGSTSLMQGDAIRFYTYIKYTSFYKDAVGAVQIVN